MKTQDKDRILIKLEKAIDASRLEYYKLTNINAQSALMWEGVRLGLQDAIRIIEGEDLPSYIKEELDE